MPQTFYDYLRNYPEVFSWYRTLTSPEAGEFENNCRSQLEAGQAVATQIPPPVMQPPIYTGEACCYILYPPVGGFITAPSQNSDLHVPAGWNVVPSRLHQSYSIFVPYHCFQKCAECLETPDLRATLVRVIRVLRYLEAPAPGPYDYIIEAEKWRNFRQSLVRYGIYCAEEYAHRGGSNKVLEHLKPLVRRREWNKPEWVYDPNALDRQREHLMFRSYRRCVAKAIHKIQPKGISFFRSQVRCTNAPRFYTLQDCDECTLECFRVHIVRDGVQMPNNFYAQYNWNVNAHKGNFA